MFRGSIVALVTPMNNGGSIDEAALEALVHFHIEKGTDAIVAMGTTGESATLSHSEHRYVVKRVVDLVAGKIPVIAGTGSNSTQEALELTQGAKEDGADACLLVTPYYNKPTQEGLFQHYKLIAESVDIPQILYNVPGRTGCDMLPETIIRLSRLQNITGVKEATGDLSRLTALQAECDDGFDLYSGDDGTAMEFILQGGHANISVTANVAPAEMHEMCQAALSGDREKAELINNKLQALNESLFLESNPIPVKWAVHKMGYGSENGLRLPLLPLAEEYRSTVLNAMASADVDA